MEDESEVPDDIDYLLANSALNSLQADFKPEVDCLRLCCLGVMQFLKNQAKNEDDNQYLGMAMGCIMMHLEHAYPDLRPRD